jgi:hypothetical protein
MELETGRNLIGLTTDNPTVMQSFRGKFQLTFYWVLVSAEFIISQVGLSIFQLFACFLHGLNMILGKIASYPTMKQVATKSACIVSYFNSSHYWGGQLDMEARSLGVSRSLKTNTKTRWYALILQALSVQSYRYVQTYSIHVLKCNYNL